MFQEPRQQYLIFELVAGPSKNGWSCPAVLTPTRWASRPNEPQILVGLPAPARAPVLPPMSTKSRQAIYGGQIIGAKIRAESARKRAAKATREADRAEAGMWSIQMEAYGGPAQPSPTIGQCLNGGYGCPTKPSNQRVPDFCQRHPRSGLPRRLEH